MNSSQTSFSKPIRQTVFVADLKCYMCGGVSGTIESEQSFTEAGGRKQPVLLRQTPQSSPERVVDWTRLRCCRCGGPLFLDETDVITRRIDEYNWLEERPRRGRPPKRLLEERRLERELLEREADPQAA